MATQKELYDRLDRSIKKNEEMSATIPQFLKNDENTPVEMPDGTETESLAQLVKRLGGQVTTVNGEVGNVVIDADSLNLGSAAKRPVEDFVLSSTLDNVSKILDGSQSQKEINLYGGKKYDMPVGGYPVGAKVLLDDNVTEVISTVASNTNDPNINMTGWEVYSSDKYIKTWSGRTQESKNKDQLNIKDYGAVVGQSAVIAINAMETDVGFVVIPYGDWLIDSNITINVPLYFDYKAALNTATGITTTIRRQVKSSNQYIFKGDGNYNLEHDNTLNEGENVRQLHVSWFGIEPGSTNVVTQMQKALDSMGNGRESTFDLDIGNYVLNSTLRIPRCMWFRGQGERRTIIQTELNGFDLIETKQEGSRLSDFQFEPVIDVIRTRTSGHWINLKHSFCTVENVNIGHTNYGIIDNGVGNNIRNIRALYRDPLAADSYAINIAGSSIGSNVDNVKLIGTSNNPTYSVLVGGANQTGTISGTTIKDIKALNKIGVVANTGYTIARCNISDINMSQATNNIDAAVELNVNGGSIIESFVTGVQATNKYDNIVLLNQAGTMTNIVVNDVVGSGDTGRTQYGVKHNYVSGTATNVIIGEDIAVTNRTKQVGLINTPKTGGVINLKVEGEYRKPQAIFKTMADNTEHEFTVYDSVFAALLFVAYDSDTTSGSASSIIRLAATSKNIQQTANANIEFGLLKNVTNATAGKLTVAVNANNNIKIINKLGYSVNVSVLLSI